MYKIRKYSNINCKTCNKELRVRSDYIKIHTGYCPSCRKKEDWKNESYAKKCSESHKGKKMPEQQKEKLRLANSGRTRTAEECMRISEGRKKQYGYASANHIYRRYMATAKKRKYSFDLTIDDFIAITSKPCRYCGASPKMISMPHERVNGKYVHNGIDRVDNKLGYTITNSVPCCTHCNFAKHTMSESEFVQWGKDLYYNFIVHYQCDTVGSRSITTK